MRGSFWIKVNKGSKTFGPFKSKMAHETEACVVSVEANQAFAKIVGVPKSQSAETMNVRFVGGPLLVGVETFAALGATKPNLLGKRLWRWRDTGTHPEFQAPLGELELKLLGKGVEAAVLDGGVLGKLDESFPTVIGGGGKINKGSWVFWMGNLWALAVEPKQIGIDKVEPTLFVLRGDFKKTKEKVGAILIKSWEVAKPSNPLSKGSVGKFCLGKDHAVSENFVWVAFISSGNCASDPHVAGLETFGDGGIAIRHDMMVVVELAVRDRHGKVLLRDGKNSWVLESFVLEGFGGAGGNGIPVLVFLITCPVGLDPIPKMFVFESKMDFAGTLRQKNWKLELHLVVHLELNLVGSLPPC